MALDISAIRNKLNKLQNNKKKSDLLWKPTPGTHQVRIVPYKFRPDNPFIELFFHYNINNKTYLSPISFGNPDPIYEFAEKLKTTGDKEDWKTGKNMEPKLRTFVPIIERGKENEGVKFWGFGKTVYQELLAHIADPDYGDITNPVSGRDIAIEYIAAKEAGNSYPTTTIRVKPNQSRMIDDIDLAKKLVDEQSEITDVYDILSYDELKDVLQRWLSGEEETTSDLTDDNDDSEDGFTTSSSPTNSFNQEIDKPTSNIDEVDAAFSALFDKK